MIVQQKIRFLLKLSLFSILIMFAFILHKAIQPKFFKIHHSPCNSILLQKKIENIIELKLLDNAKDIKDKLQKISQSLESISIVKSATKFAYLKIKSAKPILKLYNTQTDKFTILADNKNIVEPQEYASFYIDNLPIIYVNNNLKISMNSACENLNCLCSDFYNFSSKLTSEIYDQFYIFWFKNTEILFKDKRQSLVIVTDINSISDKNKLDYAQKLFQLKENEKIIKIDIRFKDMIILEKGGNNEKSQKR